MYNMIVTLDYVKKERAVLQRAEIIPIYTDNTEEMKVGDNVLPMSRFIPKPAEGIFAQEILSSIIKWSGEIEGNNTKFTPEGDRMIVDLKR